MQRWVSDQQLAERYSVSRATIWRWAKDGVLPPPRKISLGTTRWDLVEVERTEAERRLDA